MTRSTIQDKRYCLPPAKTLKKYEEKFPEDYNASFRPRITSCPAALPSFLHREILRAFDDSLAKVREESIAELTAENRVGNKVRRRHSWSVGTENTKNKSILDNAKPKVIIQRKLSGGSRKSSVASVPEVIEECSSDEEISEEFNESYDYMHCINCSRSSSTSSLEMSDTQQHIIQSCYKCKHLFQTKNTFLSVYKEGRRSSWSGESSTSSPRRSRRGSLTDSIELPIIAEPFIDEETDDTVDLQKMVELDINKLLKFNRGIDIAK